MTRLAALALALAALAACTTTWPPGRTAEQDCRHEGGIWRGNSCDVQMGTGGAM